MNIFRKYGNSPYKVVLVHGGPGGPGDLKPVAQELAKKYGVLEALQTKKTIAGEVEELKEIITQEGKAPVVLIGWSWGAWLSFIATSLYPNLVQKLVLIGSGPFEADYAKTIMPTRLSRLSTQDKLKAQEYLKLNQIAKYGHLIFKADSFKPLPVPINDLPFQPEIYQSIWPEADKLRKSGRLLEYGQNITCPVIVIHGDYDPHPFEGVKKPLSKIIKDIKFHLLKNCGHYPWLEKETKDKFFSIINQICAGDLFIFPDGK